MNRPQVCMCPRIPPRPPRCVPALFQSTGFGRPASCIEVAQVICFTCSNVHVPVLFSQITPPSPSPIESRTLFFASVSPLLPCMWDCWSRLSKFHVHVFIFGTWLTSLRIITSLQVHHLWAYFKILNIKAKWSQGANKIVAVPKPFYRHLWGRFVCPGCVIFTTRSWMLWTWDRVSLMITPYLIFCLPSSQDRDLNELDWNILGSKDFFYFFMFIFCVVIIISV